MEVLEGRAREPTGPIKAPRTYPGPASPGNSLLQALDAETNPRLRPSCLASDLALLRPLALRQIVSSRSRFFTASVVVEGSDNKLVDKLGLDRPIAAREAANRFGGEGQERGRGRRRGVGRRDGCWARSGFDGEEGGSDIEHGGSGGEGGASGEAWKTGRSDRWWWWAECGPGRGGDKEWWWWWWGVRVVQQRRGVAEEPEDRAEPGKGSLGGSETGERNVAKRRHGRPCGQQSMDEIDGHCPQGETASRFGLCRCRRFRCSGLCDDGQQRPDPQSVSFQHHSPSPFSFFLVRVACSRGRGNYYFFFFSFEGTCYGFVCSLRVSTMVFLFGWFLR